MTRDRVRREVAPRLASAMDGVGVVGPEPSRDKLEAHFDPSSPAVPDAVDLDRGWQVTGPHLADALD